MSELPKNRIIGLTGMSGAGKSTACEAFKKRGFAVIDCDEIARNTASDSGFLAELGERFPERLVGADGRLDRMLTAKYIFNDSEKRRLYERIIFPYIIYGIMRAIRAAGKDVLLDAPTLFEAGLDIICGGIVSVTAPKDLCAKRIGTRDGISEERALERLSAQHSAEYYRERSDYSLENDGTAVELFDNTNKIIDKLTEH